MVCGRTWSCWRKVSSWNALTLQAWLGQLQIFVTHYLCPDRIGLLGKKSKCSSLVPKSNVTRLARPLRGWCRPGQHHMFWESPDADVNEQPSCSPNGTSLTLFESAHLWRIGNSRLQQVSVCQRQVAKKTWLWNVMNMTDICMSKYWQVGLKSTINFESQSFLHTCKISVCVN